MHLGRREHKHAVLAMCYRVTAFPKSMRPKSGRCPPLPPTRSELGSQCVCVCVSCKVHSQERKRVGGVEETWNLVLVPTMCLALRERRRELAGKESNWKHMRIPWTMSYQSQMTWWKEVELQGGVGREEELNNGLVCPALKACWA